MGWRQDHWTHKLVAFKCDDPSVHSWHLGPVWLPTTPSSGTLSLLFDPHRCHRHSCCLLECHIAQRSSYLIGCLFFDLFTFLWIQFSFKHLKSCLVFQPRSDEAMTRKKNVQATSLVVNRTIWERVTSVWEFLCWLWQRTVQTHAGHLVLVWAIRCCFTDCKYIYIYI